ncbi:hypothetical protein Tco_0801293 [Tanacetum coccineum]|uniref:Uncharacterized protein n=1 Tax=Tanacetum coccineum TaxID=301880 RepID=A0ABQ4ZWH5_9ASTR
MSFSLFAIKEMEQNMTLLCDLDPMLNDAKILPHVISIWKSLPKQRPNEVWSLDALLQDQALSDKKCVHLIRQHGENYDDYFPDELNVLVGERLLFRFHYTDDHINNTNHVYQLKMLSQDVGPWYRI